MASWSSMRSFEFTGVLLYPDATSASSSDPTMELLWNGQTVAPNAWLVANGNPCIYFEFSVEEPGATVAPSDDPCNPPSAHLKFGGVDAKRADVQMVVTQALLFGPGRRGLPGPNSSTATSSQCDLRDSSLVCSRQEPRGGLSTSSSSSSSSATTTTPDTSGDFNGGTTTSARRSSLSTTRRAAGTSSPTPGSWVPSLAPTRSSMQGLPPSSTGLAPTDHAGLRPSAVFGIVAGSLAGLFVLLLAIAVLRRSIRRRKHEREHIITPEPYDASTIGARPAREKPVVPESMMMPPPRRASGPEAGPSDGQPMEEPGFRDFYSAMRRAGLTVQSLMEHHREPHSRAPDRLPDYTTG
ncbi:hypothetical protein BKA62DRAFT_722354 [Auriculariales sp. MPI-PUGE-AT-0066]|nr:hypothetical protein BKA62DRAFT_722354 [Auriculariales sp. MPI-PUGE-AT-0066]